MSFGHRRSFIENKERLAEIQRLGKKLETETDPEKRESLKKEIEEKGKVLKTSIFENFGKIEEE